MKRIVDDPDRIRPRGQSRHGTTSRYGRHGCRCGPCVKVYRAYQRAWRDRNPLYHPIYLQFYRELP